MMVGVLVVVAAVFLVEWYGCSVGRSLVIWPLQRHRLSRRWFSIIIIIVIIIILEAHHHDFVSFGRYLANDPFTQTKSLAVIRNLD